ncbi:MAG: hypothetical protein P4M00_20180 [Azospirillaceae bacterium]|nr:hypothetical protein [Azospirillaceae bacterium]
MGSVSAGRLDPRLTSCVTDVGRTSTGLTYEQVDLAERATMLEVTAPTA